MIAHELLPVPAAVHEVQGLLRTPKSLPPKLFYDEAGSELFERITELPEYYLTRTETAVLRSAADEIAAAAPVASLVELGAGTSTKTRILIAALLKREPGLAFFPVDISIAPLHAARVALRREFPRLHHAPVIADLAENLSFLSSCPAPRLVLYLGSSIGNFEPMEVASLLCRIRRRLAPGDSLLLGADMRKEPDILLAAYDDAQGVTAAFNKNILARINRELGGHFDLSEFKHLVRWNGRESRIEIYLQSLARQSVRINALDATIDFEPGELIHTENSYKYSDSMLEAMLCNAGFVPEKTWKDKRGWFADTLARVPQ
jgi:L-histidine Nalpha-methyltransferase